MSSSSVEYVPPLDGGRGNWLRAGVLGATDGIVSVAAILVGVAGATSATIPLVAAGAAALIGGAISMALGEYVSVSSQRDVDRRDSGEAEHVSSANPWHAALASASAFAVGGLLPLFAVPFPPAARITVIFGVVVAALALTGATSARLSERPIVRPIARVVVGGSLALVATFVVGSLFGTAVG